MSEAHETGLRGMVQRLRARLGAVWIAAGAAVFGALFVYASLWSAKSPAIAVTVALIAVVAAAALRKLRTTPSSLALLLAGLGVYATYFSYTGPRQRDSDASEHVAYIEWLLKNHSLPPADRCVVCHHPPLYYVTSAAVWRAAEWTGLSHPEVALQLWSFVLFTVFAAVSARTLEHLLDKPYLRTLALSLIVFWPYSVLNSERVSNDLMLYPLAALCFHALVRWSKEGKAWLLAGACVSAGVALLVKSNALVLVTLVGAGAALGAVYATDRKRLLKRAAIPTAALLVFALGLELARGRPDESLVGKVLGSAYRPTAAYTTPRTLRYYLTFDPTAIVRGPYVDTLHFRSQEPSFWNHLIKSSLFGTRNPPRFWLVGAVEANAQLASAENAALLALLGTLLVGAAITVRDSSRVKTLCLLYAGAFTASALTLHLIAPLGFHADFRLIYPVVVPVSTLFAMAVDGMRRRRLFLWHAGYITSSVFVVLAVAYFMPFTFPSTRLPTSILAPNFKFPHAPAPPRTPPPAPSSPISR